ncbi:transposase [Clostridium boliviensis]|uniref:Transposase n=1 Tax=Clostridium boliviensis TaxID=318465 RepID=A0ABU4GPW0_9CLOT|nr:transposase [Clostridium boliviensis]MDW2799660.1 transposase [Clostridium boliviensis]
MRLHSYCNQLFQIEKELKDLEPEERQKKRLELERPVLDAFWKWTNGINALGGSKLAKAINYAQNQRSYMENYRKCFKRWRPIQFTLFMLN